MRKGFILSVALFGFFSSFNLQAQENIHIMHAWVAEAPPNAKVMAGYMVLHNMGKKDVQLLAVSCPMFSSVEMHRTIIEQGMARMVRDQHLTIKAGESVSFQPGGRHLMMFNPVKRLKQGDKLDITLVFTHSKKTTQATVKRKKTVKQSNQHGDHEHQEPTKR